MLLAWGGQGGRVLYKLYIAAAHCAAGRRKVLWFNMREEPVIYINGNPYVVREANKPFANLEYTGQSSMPSCVAYLAEMQ